MALLIGLCVLFGPHRGSAQTEFGASGGAVFGWPQDVTVEERDRRGRTLAVAHENSLAVDRGDVWRIGGTYWWQALSSLGVEYECVAWRNPVDVSLFPTMTQRRFGEDHTAALANVTGRLTLSGSARGYLYGGLGGGPVVDRLKGSRTSLGPAVSLLAGVCFPMRIGKISACLDSRYVITRDFDALVRENGMVQNLEFSGHPSVFAGRPILGPHMDSRFLAVLLGIHWSRR